MPVAGPERGGRQPAQAARAKVLHVGVVHVALSAAPLSEHDAGAPAGVLVHVHTASRAICTSLLHDQRCSVVKRPTYREHPDVSVVFAIVTVQGPPTRCLCLSKTQHVVMLQECVHGCSSRSYCVPTLQGWGVCCGASAQCDRGVLVLYFDSSTG